MREISGILETARRGDLRDRAARRDADGHRASRRSRLQRRALSRRSRCLRRNGWKRTYGQPFTRTVPIGVGATRAFIEEVAALAGVDPAAALDDETSRSPWYSRSVDSTYLTDKRVFIFGDATHAIAAARVARAELGFKVVGLGTYSREFARERARSAPRPAAPKR